MAEFVIPPVVELRQYDDQALLEFRSDLLAACAEAEAHIAGIKAKGEQIYPGTASNAKRLRDWQLVVRSLLVERGIEEFAPTPAITAKGIGEAFDRMQHAMARFGNLWLAADRYVGDTEDSDESWERLTMAVEELRPYMLGGRR